MLQADDAWLVTRDRDPLRTPRLVGTVGHEARPEADGLQEVEARAERAGHGEDRASVALECGKPGVLQRLPRRPGMGSERHRCAGRRAAARRDARAVAKR